MVNTAENLEDHAVGGVVGTVAEAVLASEATGDGGDNFTSLVSSKSGGKKGGLDRADAVPWLDGALHVACRRDVRDTNAAAGLVTGINAGLERANVGRAHVTTSEISGAEDFVVSTISGGSVGCTVAVVVVAVGVKDLVGRDTSPNAAVCGVSADRALHVTLWGDIGDINTAIGVGAVLETTSESGCLGQGKVTAGVVNAAGDLVCGAVGRCVGGAIAEVVHTCECNGGNSIGDGVSDSVDDGWPR